MENFLAELEVAGVDITIGKVAIESIHDIERFVEALKFLIESREARSDLPRKNEMGNDLKARFSSSIHGRNMILYLLLLISILESGWEVEPNGTDYESLIMRVPEV